jgi:cell division protease FtsH
MHDDERIPRTLDDLPGWLRAGRLDLAGLSLEDYVGNDHARDEARRLVARVRGADRFRDAGLPVPRAILVAGPYGVGKTHLARLIAAELGAGTETVVCFEVNAAHLSPARVEELARVLPALGQRVVIVVDEVDVVAGRRGMPALFAPARSADATGTLVALLGLLDGLRRAEQVTWIFTTSASCVDLDGALLRPGRVDLTIVLEPPRRDERAALVRYFARDLPVAEDVDPVVMADAIGPGATPAVIAGVMADALAMAIDAGGETITVEHLDAAVRRRLTSVRRMEVRPADRRRLAIHEAGHAVVAAVLGSVPARIEIRDVDGVTTHERQTAGEGSTETEVRNRIAVCLAGIAAERAVTGEGSLGSELDVRLASGLARSLVLSGCSDEMLMHPDAGGPVLAGDGAAIAAAVAAILAAERDRAVALIEQHRAAIEALAARLETSGRLAGDEVAAALAELGVAAA